MEDLLSSKYGEHIRVLSATLWENKVQGPKLLDWLNNFENKREQNCALYLLSRLMYFGSSSIRNLLKALYRDLYRYPIIEKIRKDNQDTLEKDIIEDKFNEVLAATRFMGLGNSSESGNHLLYYFRQENNLNKNLFITVDNIIEIGDDGTPRVSSSIKDVKNFIIIDDLCGSGSQATLNGSNAKRCVQKLRRVIPSAKISYFTIFGMSEGIKVVMESKLYDQVKTVVELDESYRCFGEYSRFFGSDEKYRQEAKNMAYKYGRMLLKSERDALGYSDCQLLLSMHYNTPNNTLPIIWFDNDNSKWKPIFKRYDKQY